MENCIVRLSFAMIIGIVYSPERTEIDLSSFLLICQQLTVIGRRGISCAVGTLLLVL